MNPTLRALNGFRPRRAHRRAPAHRRPARLAARAAAGWRAQRCARRPRPRRDADREAIRAFRGRQAAAEIRRRGAGCGAGSIEHCGRRKPGGARRARHDRAAVRRAARRLLVESPVHLRRREGARGAARRQLRARGHPPARARPLRGHGARVGEASGDARLSRQFPVDRSELAGAGARGAAAARRRRAGSTKTTRASCSSCTRSASTAATRSRTCRSSRRF